MYANLQFRKGSRPACAGIEGNAPLRSAPLDALDDWASLMQRAALQVTVWLHAVEQNRVTLSGLGRKSVAGALTEPLQYKCPEIK
jgi:hypothetical protein